MRLWSLSPAQLDRAALVAGWREGLLAQRVLAGGTRGYRNHPQLDRFRAHEDPVAVVGAYLAALADEADARGYRFDRARLVRPSPPEVPMTVTQGQLELEWAHLLAKCVLRSPDWADRLRAQAPLPHPLLSVVPGPVECWERAAPAPGDRSAQD